jgi:hypothetical protein
MAFFFFVGGGAIRPYEHRHWRTPLREACLIAARRTLSPTPEKGGSFDVGVPNLYGLRGTPNDADEPVRAVDAIRRDGRQDFLGCSMESSGA